MIDHKRTQLTLKYPSFLLLRKFMDTKSLRKDSILSRCGKLIVVDTKLY